MLVSHSTTKNIGATPDNRSDKPWEKLTACRHNLITLTWCISKSNIQICYYIIYGSCCDVYRCTLDMSNEFLLSCELCKVCFIWTKPWISAYFFKFICQVLSGLPPFWIFEGKVPTISFLSNSSNFGHHGLKSYSKVKIEEVNFHLKVSIHIISTSPILSIPHPFPSWSVAKFLYR